MWTKLFEMAKKEKFSPKIVIRKSTITMLSDDATAVLYIGVFATEKGAVAVQRAETVDEKIVNYEYTYHADIVDAIRYGLHWFERTLLGFEEIS